MSEPDLLRREPAGPPRGSLLLLPGNDLVPEFYAPLLERLAARGLRAAAVRVPSFLGETGDVPAGWEGPIRRALAATRAHLSGGGLLVGHSLGGLLALLVAARRPPEVRRLALLEPAIAPWQALARRAAAAYRVGVVERDRDRFVNWTGAVRRVARPEAFPPEALELYLSARRRGDPALAGALLAALPALYPLPFDRVEVPVLLVRGARSGWRATLGAWLLAGRLGDARLEVVPEAAHWLANEADDALADALARFAR